MAFNSDGYIMVDFTEVDFTRTNQTIDGLFERVKSVVGTNKFVLVINANHRTPLPATVTITNNQYVIQAVVYTFSIASNDLLHIQRNYPPESDLIQDDVISILTTWSSYKINEELQSKTEIDDTTISDSSTWSSNKINDELEDKANITALADYQPLLTTGDYINISENNVISSNAGSNILEYVGTGTTTNNIEFPVTPKFIAAFIRPNSDGNQYDMLPIIWGFSNRITGIRSTTSQVLGVATIPISFSGNILTLSALTVQGALNEEGVTYKVIYFI